MKTFTLLFLLLVATFAQAQIRRGDHLLSLNPPTFGNLTVPGDFSSALLYTNTTYGFALSNRLVLGGTLTATQDVGVGPERYGMISLTPYLRYYGINKERLGVYGQVASGFRYSNERVTGFSSVVATAGVQLPITTGVRFGPTVSYNVNEFFNDVLLSTTLEVVLGKNTRSEDNVVADFHRGTVMLGGHTAYANLQKGTSFGGLSVSGYYFLNERLAARAYVGASGYRSDYTSLSLNIKNRQTGYSFGVGSRYYLTTERRLLWFGEAGVGYQGYRSLYEFDGNTERGNSGGVQIALSGGAQLFIRENVALEAGPYWSRSYVEGEGNSFVGLNVGANFLLR